MKNLRSLLSGLFWTSLLIPAISHAQQPWSGIISPSRAANWSYAGVPGGIPDGSWTQCGSTIAAYGSASSYASPATIQNEINSCPTKEFVLLGAGDFYLSGGVNLKTGVVLRGSGANQTRIHVNATANCNGEGGIVCIVGSNTYSGSCVVGGPSWWTCPAGQYSGGYQYQANWTGGYVQGSNTITLDNVTGIVTNLTPIVLDQCDTGLAGSPGVENCTGVDGVITAATTYPGAGGRGYNVGDTGKINCTMGFGQCFGSGTATYSVSSVSGGAVTGLTITNGGNGYTYTSTNSTFGAPTLTTTTTGSGSGFEVQVTGITGYDNKGFFVCSIAIVCESEGPAGTARNGRSQSEVVMAASISGSGPYTVTLTRPLMHPNWVSGLAPQAWWGGSTITNAGVEDMLLDVSTLSASCVDINTASGVWIKGVACNTANFFHVLDWVATNFTIRDSYFYWTKYGSTTSYGIGSGGEIGNALFENNIIQGVVDPLNPAGTCTGCVFAYNYSVNQWDTASSFMFVSSPMHTAATDYILEEGNIGAGTNLDTIHGAHLANTFFRNYFDGLESNNGTMPMYNTTPAIIGAFSRYNNFLANVLGTPGYHTVYQCVPALASSPYCTADPNGGGGAGFHHIWDIAWSHTAQIDYNNTPPELNDTLTTTSLYRYGNYDVVNGAVQWNSSEVPTADPNFPNPVPSSNAFPSSFYNGVTAAFPNCGTGLSFWKNPTTGSCPPYPPIGPDVTGGDMGMCTGGTYQWSRALNSAQCAGGSFTASVDGGYGYSNPAMRCYLNQMAGPPDGTGSMLTFNRTSCYASDSSSGTALPAPPLNLNGTPVSH